MARKTRTLFARVEPSIEETVQAIADECDRSSSAVVRLLLLKGIQGVRGQEVYKRLASEAGLQQDPEQLLRPLVG